MSIELLHGDKREVIDLMEKLLQRVAYHKLAPAQISACRTHLEAMRLDPKTMFSHCQFAADEKGRTQLILTCSFGVAPENIGNRQAS